MPNFDQISLRSYKIGGQEIGFTVSEKMMHVAGEDITWERWQEIVERADRQAIRGGWKEKPPKFGNAAPLEGRGSNFLGENLSQIIEVRERGHIRNAPFWLRWLFDGVITKESYNGHV